jgi:hypothetical protein
MENNNLYEYIDLTLYGIEDLLLNSYSIVGGGNNVLDRIIADRIRNMDIILTEEELLEIMLNKLER